MQTVTRSTWNTVITVQANAGVLPSSSLLLLWKEPFTLHDERRFSCLYHLIVLFALCPFQLEFTPEQIEGKAIIMAVGGLPYF